MKEKNIKIPWSSELFDEQNQMANKFKSNKEDMQKLNNEVKEKIINIGPKEYDKIYREEILNIVQKKPWYLTFNNWVISFIDRSEWKWPLKNRKDYRIVTEFHEVMRESFQIQNWIINTKKVNEFIDYVNQNFLFIDENKEYSDKFWNMREEIISSNGNWIELIEEFYMDIMEGINGSDYDKLVKIDIDKLKNENSDDNSFEEFKENYPNILFYVKGLVYKNPLHFIKEIRTTTKIINLSSVLFQKDFEQFLSEAIQNLDMKKFENQDIFVKNIEFFREKNVSEGLLEKKAKEIALNTSRENNSSFFDCLEWLSLILPAYKLKPYLLLKLEAIEDISDIWNENIKILDRYLTKEDIDPYRLKL